MSLAIYGVRTIPGRYLIDIIGLVEQDCSLKVEGLKERRAEQPGLAL